MSEDGGTTHIRADAVSSFHRETTVTVALDPATARPHRARYEQIAGVDARRTVEIRDTAFDWSASTGCALQPAAPSAPP